LLSVLDHILFLRLIKFILNSWIKELLGDSRLLRSLRKTSGNQFLNSRANSFLIKSNWRSLRFLMIFLSFLSGCVVMIYFHMNLLLF
jgi:hypothetical protein